MLKIIQGDCNQVMKRIRRNTIDTIITDPPYGIKFMNKKWDYNIPSKRCFKRMLRIAKPGATLLCFGGTRTYHRIACNIEDAGWIIKDCIMWLYGQGFPKSTNISKQLDKGYKRKVIGLSNRVIAKKPTATTYVGQNKNFSETAKGREASKYITEPATNVAKLWNGWGTALKPAYEPVLWAIKPNEGTYAANALKWGVSGLNIDGSRIKFEKDGTVASNPALRVARGCKTETGDRIFCQGELGKKNTMVENVAKGGRFPANVILDEEAGAMLDEQSGISKSTSSGYNFELGNQDNPSRNVTNIKSGVHHGDSGGASRFFYCSKSSKRERNLGCEGVEEAPIKGRDEGQDKLNVPYKQRPTPVQNNHPCIKPLALMKYLCTLTKTPFGGIVLDPFMGSGTTGIACKLTGRHFIGIEREKEYCKISKLRMKAYKRIKQKNALSKIEKNKIFKD